MTGQDLNTAIHLDRLVAYRADGSVSAVVVSGRLNADGVYAGPAVGAEADAAAVQEGVAFAGALAGALSALTESSDTDAPYVPFVLPRALSAADLETLDWLGLLPLPGGEAEVTAQPSGFRLADVLARREAQGNAADFYAPGEMQVIRDAAAGFTAHPERRLVTVTAGQVALLLLDLAHLPGGAWAGVATLRIDT